MPHRIGRTWIAVLFAWAAHAQEPERRNDSVPTPAVDEGDRAVKSALEAQVELHRRGLSCGSIDGVMGPQTATAIRAFQRRSGLRVTGMLDAATSAQLRLSAPVLATHIVTPEDLAALSPVPPTWLEKSQVQALNHATLLELVAERYRSSPRLLRQLNPTLAWETASPGSVISVPAVNRVTFTADAARIVIRLEGRTLEALDQAGNLIAQFPVSIARKVEKRPLGELRTTVVILDPNYTFDPEVYPESPEAKQLGRKLVVPPGPNNPVGRAWIGLNLPGYGIHGTPDPEKVGRTESHGCFRLANWDAVALVSMVSVGLPVQVEP